MTMWEDFEINCTRYLNEHFGQYAKFTHLGVSNSTVADIKVEVKNNKVFYIEAKHSPAQCGQFVLLPNIQQMKFDYSKLNIVPLNESSIKIIDHMNENFEKYKEAGTSGEDIDFPNCSEVFSKWIVNYYKSKNVKFFITNNYTIFPIEQFSDYFVVKAKYRVKRSGSSSVGNSKTERVKEFITKNFLTKEVSIKDDKVFVVSEKELHNSRFVMSGNEYMFSKRGNVYEIRKLSNTFNANVIFSIYLKPNKQGVSADNFIFILLN